MRGWRSYFGFWGGFPFSPSVTQRIPSVKVSLMRVSWQTAAASVVLPNPPAPYSAMVTGTGSFGLCSRSR
jgi:hypothetical protein